MNRSIGFLVFLGVSASAYAGQGPIHTDDTGKFIALPLFASIESRRLAVDIADGKVDPLELVHGISKHAITPSEAVYHRECSVMMSSQHKDTFGAMYVAAVFTYNLPMPEEMEKAIRQKDGRAQARYEIENKFSKTPAGKVYEDARQFYRKAGFHITDQGGYLTIDHPAEEALHNKGRQLGIIVFKGNTLAECPNLPSGPTLVMSIHAQKM